MQELLRHKTSIIILTFNKLEYTEACIDSIRRYTQRGTYEIIVVDNCSTDGTREWLAEQTDIVTYFNEENVGFPKGCNQGMEIASGDSILLLNNDTVVTENWLPLLVECLYSSEDIGAVGPITNSAYGYQEMSVNYKSLDEMWSFAKEHNRHDPSQWEQRLKLIGYCLLIKKEAVNKVGNLDELFTPGMCEDSDYCIRLIQAGYRNMLCNNVFIHHFGSTSWNEMPEKTRMLLLSNREKYLKKWGFHTAYSTEIRHDLLNMMDDHPEDEALRILDIGCACGGTLLRVKYKYKKTELYGIERNVHAAAIASTFANVKSGNVEELTLDYPEGFFDYIILGNVIEQLHQPNEVLAKLNKFLKNGGRVIAGISNVMHHSVIRNLIHGRWSYGENGPLDRNNIRFFTLNEIENLFEEAMYKNVSCNAMNLPSSEQDEQWISVLNQLSGQRFNEQYRVYQYLVKAYYYKTYTEIESILVNIEKDIEKQHNLEKLVKLIRDSDVDTDGIIRAVEEAVVYKQTMYNLLASTFYNNNLFENIVPLLDASLKIDNKHVDTLFNFAFILYKVGADEQALYFLNQIEVKDSEAIRLLDEIQAKLNI